MYFPRISVASSNVECNWLSSFSSVVSSSRFSDWYDDDDDDGVFQGEERLLLLEVLESVFRFRDILVSLGGVQS